MSTEVTPPPTTVGDFLEPRPYETVKAEADEVDEAPIGRGYGPPAKKPSDSSQFGVFKSNLPCYRLHCRSSRNNTTVTFTEPDGKCISWFSGGSLKFKKANRASYEAGYQCAVQTFKKIEEVNAKEPLCIHLFLSGFGQGRDAMKTALLSVEGENIKYLVKQIQDRTPIKIGGTRSKKARRL
ncbi:hypothetical protein NLJ89_g5314 [Agrocybe chaxingu]|uniref:Translational machinery component n=1 Tax=Agrocybe chaxingu TaxID=84603 RepID=A0A9W8K0F6_9AGAR|nr:hypothetical protein NLJ89_g5314 [Agrocybe chaxingu]